MDSEKKKEVLKNMIEVADKTDLKLEKDSQTIQNVLYLKDFEFGNSGLAEENVYIVEITNHKLNKTVDNDEDLFVTYEIYDKYKNLIATVSSEGKIHFAPEYLEQLKQIDTKYFEQLKLDELIFELPEKLNEKDIIKSKEELDEYKELEGLEKDKEENREEKEEEEEEETEEEKKEKTAKALGIEAEEIKSICTINPNEKITDKYNLRDIMPEASDYEEVSIVYSKQKDKSYGQFTIVGIDKNGNREKINSIEPIEGVDTNQNVVSINEDGSRVEEKQVKGLFRINSRNRDDGISVAVGDYGMMELDYVNNINNEENRRVTPIRTEGAENQRMPKERVKEKLEKIKIQ